jgi:hypothetical protein
MSEEKESPWGAQYYFVRKMLEPSELFVAKWNKKQVRFLSNAAALINVIKSFIKVDVAWLSDLITTYMKLSKYEDGYCIKQAKDVARGASTRMMFNIARWKRIWYGVEEPPDVSES